MTVMLAILKKVFSELKINPTQYMVSMIQ